MTKPNKHSAHRCLTPTTNRQSLYFVLSCGFLRTTKRIFSIRMICVVWIDLIDVPHLTHHYITDLLKQYKVQWDNIIVNVQTNKHNTMFVFLSHNLILIFLYSLEDIKSLNRNIEFGVVVCTILLDIKDKLFNCMDNVQICKFNKYVVYHLFYSVD